jgi:hypothetical protein
MRCWCFRLEDFEKARHARIVTRLGDSLTGGLCVIVLSKVDNIGIHPSPRCVKGSGGKIVQDYTMESRGPLPLDWQAFACKGSSMAFQVNKGRELPLSPISSPTGCSSESRRGEIVVLVRHVNAQLERTAQIM